MKQRQGVSPAMRAVLTDIAVLLLCAAFFGLMLLAPLASAEAALSPEEETLKAAWQRGELVRLHILAASDSPADQRIKLQVRDAVLAAFGEALEKAGKLSGEAVWQLLQREASAMETVARRRARDCGFSSKVSAQAGLLSLPEKRYGQLTLPKGVYRGLRIILGEGRGQNWWCVLFPQLCLALADDEPWTAAPEEKAAVENEGANAPPPAVQWDSERILSHWLLYPKASAPAEVATDVVDAKGGQSGENAPQGQKGQAPAGSCP